MSTLEPKCYTDYKTTQEVVDYFQTAVNLFQTVHTYEVRLSYFPGLPLALLFTDSGLKWLAAAGIEPSKRTTYKLADIKAALTAARGVSPYVSCDHGELREVWYHYSVRGSLQTGQFVPAEPDFSGQNPGKGCPAKGIKYLPKGVQNADA